MWQGVQEQWSVLEPQEITPARPTVASRTSKASSENENCNKLNKCLGCPDLVILDTKEKLDNHMALVHPEGSQYWCDQCNYNFLTDDKLMIHNKKYHGSQGSKMKRAKVDYLALIPF